VNASMRAAAAVVVSLGVWACGDGGSSSRRPPVGGSGFDLALAVQQMQLCLESYQMLADYEAGQPFVLPAPYTLQRQVLTSEHFSGEGLNGMVPIAFVATSGHAISVVFRGTKTISEWIADATLSQVAYPYVAESGMTETGFTGVYAAIRDAIVDEVNELAADETYATLYVTGHSLGGAVSVLAAIDLAAATRFTAPIVYTFAGPRAGDPRFADAYDAAVGTTWRVVNTNDEVPKLPNVVTTVIGPPPDFTPHLYFYEHVETEYDITFGEPIRSVSDLIFDHDSCNYFATLCARTTNPAQCKQMGQGVGGCQFES
jgi:triacylglycerol lipase